jgi:hypothetical protein
LSYVAQSFYSLKFWAHLVGDRSARKREGDEIESVHQAFSDAAADSGNVVVAELKRGGQFGHFLPLRRHFLRPVYTNNVFRLSDATAASDTAQK